MKCITNTDIAKHISLRLKGTASKIFLPESEGELIKVYAKCVNENAEFCVLGRGSNTIFASDFYPGVVIKTELACQRLEVERPAGWLPWAHARVYAGAGVTLQRFIRFCAENDLEAPAYLWSVPGNIGGSLVTNAGRSENDGRCISDWLIKARVFDGNKVSELPAAACDFAFRESIFARGGLLVLGGVFEMKRRAGHKTIQDIKERMRMAHTRQDREYPNAGSVFKRGFRKIPGILGHRIGGAAFSAKTPNWIVNLGGAVPQDVLGLIEFAQTAHRNANAPEPVIEIHVKR